VAYWAVDPVRQPLARIVPVVAGQILLVIASVRPQANTGDAELRGVGEATVKSLRLLLVSVQPPLARMAAVVALSPGVGEPSEQLAVMPYPTKSMTWLPVPQLLVRAVVLLTKATFPALPDKLSVPVASGVGKIEPIAVLLLAKRIK
jgi:hypothetical protein